MVPQVPGVVAWLLASSCESSPLSPRPERRLGTLVGLPTRRKAFCFPVCEDIMSVVGQQSERPAPWQLELSDFEGKCVLDFKKPKQEICPGCQRIRGGEKAAGSSGRESDSWRKPAASSRRNQIASHTYLLQTVGRGPGGRTLAATCRSAISASICSGLRRPLTALSLRDAGIGGQLFLLSSMWGCVGLSSPL